LNHDERFSAEALPLLGALYSTALRLTGKPQDAEDLVQETFLRAYRSFGQFAPGTNLRAWMHTILRNVCTDTRRKAARTLQGGELPEDGPPVAPAQEAFGAERDLERALAGLPEVFREAVILRDVEELSYEEISGVLGVPIGTVTSRIYRGRALLRSALAGPAR
jgi:RNA polymerase sigma-70 factor (ECF subfamily)